MDSSRTRIARKILARYQLDEKDRREQALRDFLANATHDVMIPLTVLQGHLSKAQEQVAAGEPVGRSLLAEAENEAHYRRPS